MQGLRSDGGMPGIARHFFGSQGEVSPYAEELSNLPVGTAKHRIR